MPPRSRESNRMGLKPSFPIRLICIVAFSCACLPLLANPFMGSQETQTPSPVRAGKAAPESLIRNQLELRDFLAENLKSFKDVRSLSMFLAIIGVSFLYGVLHALGPGHRKTVVFSIYIARKAPWWEPAATSLALAGLHGGTAILLLLLFRGVSGALSSSTTPIALYMEGFAWTALAVMAAVLLARAITDFAHGKSRADSPASLGALVLSGIYPCPGALLVLILSSSLDLILTGMAAVLAMSVGMSLPILLFSYLGWFGRAGLVVGLRKNEVALRKAGALAEIAGFAFLLAFSIYLSVPFVLSLVRLLF